MNTTNKTGALEEYLRQEGVSDNQKTHLIIPREAVWAGSTYSRSQGFTLSILVSQLLEQFLQATCPDLLKEKRQALEEQQAAAKAEFNEKHQADSELLQHLALYFNTPNNTDR